MLFRGRGLLTGPAITTHSYIGHLFPGLWSSSQNGKALKAILFDVNGKDNAMKTKLDAVIARVIAPVAVATAFAVAFGTFAAYWA